MYRSRRTGSRLREQERGQSRSRRPDAFEDAVWPDELSPTITILATGLILEVAVPWTVMWLSDVFCFDVPGWSLWLLFGGPPAASFAAAVARCVVRTCTQRPHA
jgi:hypothetical protein